MSTVLSRRCKRTRMKILDCLLTIVFLLFPCFPSVETQKSALCYLAYRPEPELLEFAEVLAEDAQQYGLEIFIMADDDNFTVPAANPLKRVHLLHMSAETSLRHNYHKAINSGGTWRYLTSWDKALLYFSVFNQNHSFVWLLEEDVFIPSVRVFRSIHELYANTSDLIVPRQELNLIGSDGLWRWIMASGRFIPPWACSMVNAVGFSRRMLAAMDRFVQWLGEVPFHEFFFNTLAVQLNFTIVTPTELSTIEYATPFFYKDIRRQPSNLWHPIKDFPQGKIWRKNLTSENAIRNRSFEFNDLQVLYNTSENMTIIEQHMDDIFVRFEIEKSNYPSNIRHTLRQQFLQFADECRKRNLSEKIIAFAMKLADHAYKLPEPPVPPLLKTKNALHLQLEKEIYETKQAIYQFSSNGTTVAELRKHAMDLIKRLTYEIRQQFFEEERLRNLTTTVASTTSTTTTTASTSLSTSLSTASQTVPTPETLQNDQPRANRIHTSTKVISMICLVSVSWILSKWKIIQRRSSFKLFLVAFVLMMMCVTVLI